MSSAFSFLSNPRVQGVLHALTQSGHEALCVGGAPRDSLLGLSPKDVDIATCAHPDRVKELFGNARVNGEKVVLRPTGLDHGTWTVSLGNEHFEITTFRRDVSTDGRRATVAFASSFEDDASRRDFTVNALGVDKDGRVKDPTGLGLNDLRDRRIRFVGDANRRCDEDALRALRYYRFQSRFGSWPVHALSREAAANTDLSNLPHERVWPELSGTLKAKSSVETFKMMKQDGVLSAVLQRDVGPKALTLLSRLVEVEAKVGVEGSSPRRLAALLGGRVDGLPFPELTKDVKMINQAMELQKQGWSDPAQMGFLASNKEVAVHAVLLKAAFENQKTRPDLSRVAWGSLQDLPLTSDDLAQKGLPRGPLWGEVLKSARLDYARSGFALDKEALWSRASKGSKSQSRDQR